MHKQEGGEHKHIGIVKAHYEMRIQNSCRPLDRFQTWTRQLNTIHPHKLWN